MIGDKAREVIAEGKAIQLRKSRPCVNLKGEEIKENDSPLTNKDCIYTSLYWGVRYEPYKRGKNTVPYLVKGDIFGIGVRLKDWQELVDVANGGELSNPKINRHEENIPQKLKFILKYTTLDENMFKVAKDNLGIELTFSLKYDKYIKDAKTLIPPVLKKEMIEKLKIKFKWNGEMY